ncbi:hypothetical protein SRABI106_04682 [Rahnella aquatilis]|nr:hypothetical protein SRABI106_04682 [Rahnella aquatilis]
MAKDKVTETSADAATVSVVVLKGKLLRHDGVAYRQNSRLSLSENDAKRLITLGFVKAFEVLLEESQQVSDPAVSVSKADEDNSLDPVTLKTENGAV